MNQHLSLRVQRSRPLCLRKSPWMAAAGFALIAMTFAGCAAPTTQRPGYSEDEYKAEQASQASRVKAANAGQFDDQKTYDETQLRAFAARLDPIAAKVEAASEALCKDMGGKQCSFEVVLDASEKGLNAHADGQRVVVYPAMVEFATNDNQLAFVIAHEFAHSIMGHVASQQKNVAIGGLLGTLGDVLASSQGVQTQGAFGKIGAQQALLRYSPEFENEADYVGLYILARAGYDIEQAPEFWRLMSIKSPNAIYRTTTHPTNPARTLAMEKTISEIKAKQAAGQKLLPNIAARK